MWSCASWCTSSTLGPLTPPELLKPRAASPPALSPHEGPSSRNPRGCDTRMDPALQTQRLFLKHPRSSPPLCLQLCSWEAKAMAASSLPGPSSWHPQSLTAEGL